MIAGDGIVAASVGRKSAAHSASVTVVGSRGPQVAAYPSAQVWVSGPLTGFLRFAATAPQSVRIQAALHAPAEGRIWPIRRVFDETVFDRIEMRVVHVSRKVAIVTDRVLPIPALPNAPFAAAGHDR